MKEFNVEGVCIQENHYMADVSLKLQKIEGLIEKNKYFTINRARQYGKTTTLVLLWKKLKDKYLVLNISFEGLGEKAFSNEEKFINTFLKLIFKRIKQNKTNNIINELLKDSLNNIHTFDELADLITKLTELSNKEIILIIDEVDKSSDNRVFLDFLGMLRNKYLQRAQGLDTTFKSVILASVYDIKNLKLKVCKDKEKKYNSPWNISANFDVDMSFDLKEIESMLKEYESYNNTGMDINKISTLLLDFTGGYPFLVSKLCKIIDENLIRNWSKSGIEASIKILLDEKNTLFDDLIKNIENYKDVYSTVYDIVVEGKKILYNVDAFEKEIILGILTKGNDNYLKVHNKIFELRIYNYMISMRSKEWGQVLTYEYRTQFVKNGELDMELILTKYQEIMYSEYRNKDAKFIEREGRLLFLCFLKPIINGMGFYFVEPETRMDNRMDIVITYGSNEYIIELKVWHGENYEYNALNQLSRYLDYRQQDTGFLISFCFNKDKDYKKVWHKVGEKRIFAIIV